MADLLGSIVTQIRGWIWAQGSAPDAYEWLEWGAVQEDGSPFSAEFRCMGAALAEEATGIPRVGPVPLYYTEEVYHTGGPCPPELEGQEYYDMAGRKHTSKAGEPLPAGYYAVLHPVVGFTRSGACCLEGAESWSGKDWPLEESWPGNVQARCENLAVHLFPAGASGGSPPGQSRSRGEGATRQLAIVSAAGLGLTALALLSHLRKP